MGEKATARTRAGRYGRETQATDSIQRCAPLSLAAGEDPIGTVPPFRQYLFTELPLPWPPEVWETRRLPAALARLRRRLDGHDLLQLRWDAIAPDPEYSRPGHTRILHFRRPEGPLAAYERREFLAPDGELGGLLEAVIEVDEDALQSFERFRIPDDVRDLLVCTHGTHDACCGTFGIPVYRALRRRHAPRSGGRLRVWRVSHIGGHRFAPTVLDFPEARCWAHLDARTLDLVVHRRGSFEPLRLKYRGWSGFGFFEQVVERELFLRHGWAWTGYLKTAETRPLDGARFDPEADPVFDEDPPSGARVRLAYWTPDGAAGAYQATVELSGRMQGRGECGYAPWQRNLYRVTRLVETSHHPFTSKEVKP